MFILMIILYMFEFTNNYQNDYKDNIKRFHTDGFITDIKLDVKTGDKLGDLCYEGYYNHCIIQSCASPIGEFIKN